MIYYSYSDAPKDVQIWGFAYSKTDNKESSATKKKPALGIIVGDRMSVKFYELKKDGTRKQGCVNAYSRNYADTYEEAVEAYNREVKNVIDELEKLIEKNKKDYIIEIKK